MDRKKGKKIRNIRIIITNTFMTISVLVIVFILILIAQGYTINRNGDIQQSGLIQIRSNPSGASVKIDGETQFSHTEINKMLSSGSHNFIISKSGYDTWQSSAIVSPGLLTRIEWVRLFPLEATSTTAKKFNDLRFASVNPSRTSILISEKNSDKIMTVSLQSEKPKIAIIELSSLLNIDSEQAELANITIDSWNANSNRVILKWIKDDSTTWFMLNLDDAEKSTNLSEVSALNISKVLFANDSASKFWLLDTEQNLYSIDTSIPAPSPTLIVEGLEKIANNKDVIAYTKLEPRETDPSTYQRILYIYRDGETNSTPLKNLGLANATTNIALGTYWDSEWLAYSTDKNVEILSGKYPSASKENLSLDSIYSEVIGFVPEIISVNPRSRIISFSGKDEYFSYDIENRQAFNFTSYQPIVAINWLDDFIIWHRNDNKIIVRDFDGQNRREILSDINNDLPIAISGNNKWLYYFELSKQKAQLEVEENPTEESKENGEPQVEEQITYTLKRMSL